VLRLVPALCGSLAVLLLLAMRRDALSRGEALVAGALAACSPWLVYHSQTARFYGPLLLAATLVTLWSLPGVGRAPRRAALALAAGLLCHPSAALLVGALAGPWFRPPVAWRPLLALAAGAAVVVLALVLGDAAVLGALQRAWEGADPGTYGATHLLLGLGYNLGPLVGLAALGGALRLLARRDERAWVLLPAAAVPPAVLLAAALAGLSMHQRYALAAVPATLLLAGHGVEGLWSRRPALGAWALALLLAAFLPGLVAYAGDGYRHDAREVADFWAREIDDRSTILVADEHATVDLYLARHPGWEEVSITEAPLDDKKRFSFARNRHDCWLALKQSRLADGYGRDFMDWVRKHFDEVTRIGEAPPPLVRHDNRYVIFHRRERVRDR
jgi:hypothetical protein